jgi:adenosylcobyric acid synthase
VSGYEIHCGISAGPALQHPSVHLAGRDDGAVSADGQVIGTYLHGLFDEPAACDALLTWASLRHARSPDYPALRKAQLDRLADAAEQHLDLTTLLSI